ncbi:hypothetical protein ABZX65_27175 [Streptomyces sp. NPDC003300]|uniref:hypothetical protein n=1 Tax=unclassified Streptomyces TaxID=2593676 RepID=UPI0033A8FE63
MTSLFMDRDGEVWRGYGTDASSGELLLACDEPRNADDRGTGPSFPWTARTVAMWFGPLAEVTAEDAEQAQLAAVDAALHEVYGLDDSAWTAAQTADYLLRIDGVHARFRPQFGRAA